MFKKHVKIDENDLNRILRSIEHRIDFLDREHYDTLKEINEEKNESRKDALFRWLEFVETELVALKRLEVKMARIKTPTKVVGIW